MTSTAFLSFAIASHAEAFTSAEAELCVPQRASEKTPPAPKRKEKCGGNTAANRNEDDSACSAS
eukprot:5772037-Amphidinium_carterae.1